jgi:SAM-dependent methyltransferase
VDLVSAGQAFHWFEPRGTRREFARILQPGGCVVLVWNERTNEPGFMRDYGALVQRYGPERPAIADAALDGFFGAGKWRMARFENRQEFDLDGLRGRLKSSSYAPLPGSEKYAPMMAELDLIFGKYARGGAVAFRYDTNVYVGQASQPVPRRP